MRFELCTPALGECHYRGPYMFKRLEFKGKLLTFALQNLFETILSQKVHFSAFFRGP